MKYIVFTLLSLMLSFTAHAQTPEDTVFSRQNIIIVLDDSGSMDEGMRVAGRKQSKMEVAKNSLQEVIKDLQGNTHLGIILLNRGWLVPIGELDVATTLQKISNLRAGGGTPLGRAMKQGTDALLELRQKDRYGSYRLLVVTDGEANDQNLVDTYIGDILARGIIVDVIGVDMKDTHTLASRAHSYRRGDNPESLTRAIAEVLAESSDTGDTAESDFELVAGISDEVASSIIATLAETSTANHPIGTSPPLSVQRSQSQQAQAPPATVAVTPGTSNPLKGLLFIGVIALGIFVIVVIIAAANRYS
jgi:uncharacterized protein YegL